MCGIEHITIRVRMPRALEWRVTVRSWFLWARTGESSSTKLTRGASSASSVGRESLQICTLFNVSVKKQTVISHSDCIVVQLTAANVCLKMHHYAHAGFFHHILYHKAQNNSRLNECLHRQLQNTSRCQCSICSHMALYTIVYNEVVTARCWKVLGKNLRHSGTVRFMYKKNLHKI